MKKNSPLLLLGFLINSLYAVFLSSGYLAAFAGTLDSVIMQGLFFLLKYLAWASLGVQVFAVLLSYVFPQQAFFVGSRGAIVLLPLSFLFIWGLSFQIYENNYAKLEKILVPPSSKNESYAFALGNELFVLCIVFVALGIGCFYLPFFANLTKQCMALGSFILAANCFFIAKGIINKKYLYLLQDKLVFCPVPFKPLVAVFFKDIEKVEFANNKVYLTIRTATKSKKMTIPLLPIAAEHRTEASITLRELLKKVVTENQIITVE